MKRTAAFFRFSMPLHAVSIALALCALTRAAFAESEYEYAKLLIGRNSPSFSYDDLVERLAVHLDEAATPASKLESKLIMAALKRRIAGESTVDKRVALLKEASELYKDVAAGDPKFRLHDQAVQDSESIGMEITQALIEGAKNPAEAKKYRAEAGAMFDKRALQYKDEAEKNFPLFEAAMKRYSAEAARLNPKGDENKAPGMAFIEPLDKAFYAWIVPDQRYIAMRIEQVKALDESDPDRKKIVADAVAHCKKRVEDDNLTNFPDIVARYSFFAGSLYAAIGNEEEASKNWNDVLETDLTTLNADTKNAVMVIFKHVVHDLIKMKMQLKKYSDVEEIVAKVNSGPMRSIFEEDLGKGLLIDYAKALTIPAETAGEYEKAIKVLRGAIQKETLGSTWSNDFSRAAAEILIDARDKKLALHLTAQEWYDGAHGMSLMGQYIYTQQYERFNNSSDPKDKAQAKVKFDEAYKEFANAVDYYRRAISEARRPDHTDLATRLDVEPKAWFEMGLSYIRMKHDYEAIIAYKAMRDTFLPELRAKWLPNPKTPAGQKAYTKEVKAAIATMDLPLEKGGMVAKSGVNILIAIDQNEKLHNDPWNIGLKAKILKMTENEGPLDPTSVNDTDYIIADGDAKAANSYADSAKKSEADGKLATGKDAAEKMNAASELWTKALEKYISSADKFLKVKKESQAYDFALVHYAYVLTQAQQILVDGRIPKMPAADAEKQAKELGQKALEGYKKYDDYVAANPTTEEKVLSRRKKAEGMILLAKNTLYVGIGNWPETERTSNEYLAYETENHPARSSAPIAYLNKFRALVSEAAATPAPESDGFLKRGMQTLRDYLAAIKNDTKLHAFMLNLLSDRFNVAAFQLEKLKKKEGISKEDVDKYDALINNYEGKVAELQGERLDLSEGGSDDLSLDDYSRLVYLFNKIGQQRKAADIAIKLLKKFDPENKNMRMPDDEKTWRPFLASMQNVINQAYESFNKRDRCFNEHSVLVDYMYDTTEGVQFPENDPKRPKYDQLNENMEKALAKLEAIKNPAGEFKDCPTLTVGPTPGGKSYIALIEDEIQFRRKILAARDLLSDMALSVAKKLRAEGKDESATDYMKVAKEQIEILKEAKGGDANIEVKVAEIDIALGKTEDAMIRLMNVLPQFRSESPQYFYVKRLLSELAADQKKWNDAADFPSFVAVTQGFNSDMVKKRWPEMRAFLKTCVENGAKLPAPAQKALDAAEKAEAEPAKADEKKDAPKPDAGKEPAPEKKAEPK